MAIRVMGFRQISAKMSGRIQGLRNIRIPFPFRNISSQHLRGNQPANVPTDVIPALRFRMACSVVTIRHESQMIQKGGYHEI
ncbi:MAG: hypothetical protein B6245_02085 [Desulfobacteraceae bacterium 4572_88]|nr:MAG: hypothetical protein B6245_02085 [Desulfobacteraceae bacterium 4572_88]